MAARLLLVPTIVAEDIGEVAALLASLGLELHLSGVWLRVSELSLPSRLLRSRRDGFGPRVHVVTLDTSISFVHEKDLRKPPKPAPAPRRFCPIRPYQTIKPQKPKAELAFLARSGANSREPFM